MHNLTESFTYDNLDRLTIITKGGNDRNVGYLANGNISTKYDAGSYTYDPIKIHSISKITDTTCISAIDQALQNITYTPFKKVKTIQQQNDSLIYTYGQDMERRKMQLYENGQLVKTRIYCGMYEKDTLTDSTAKEYCYISGGSGVTAVLINEELYFLRRDVQGTITGLIDRNNNLVEEYSYDAWGRRRNPSDWTYDSVPQPQYMHRGYTFHEMLDEFGLINMNGRCYDPVVGRFLSPDIIVQNANNTQCYNRYSYAVNNPLKYTDPSGWSYSPSVRWQPSFNGMQRRAIDLIFSKNWKPSEFNELAGLLDMAGGNSLNAAIDYQDNCGHMIYTENSLSNNTSLSMPIAFITEYNKLLKQKDYTGAARYMINYYKIAESVNGVDLSCKYDLVEKNDGGNFGTIDPTESQDEEVVDQNGEKLPSKIRIVPYLMENSSPEWVYYALFHEFNHVYQFQELNMYGNPLRKEREFLAYSYTIRHAIDFRSTIKIDQGTFDGGPVVRNQGGWRRQMKENYNNLSPFLKLYYKNFFESTWYKYTYRD